MQRIALCAMLALVLAATQSFGQAGSPPQGQKPDPNNPWSMWDIQQMIQRATNEVTKRYNLTPEQTDFTRNLMATRVNAFLDRHETRIRAIFAEVFKYQMAGQEVPPELVQQWTDDITPMFDEAKVLIIEGNKEFREVLTDDQKKIHDIDLKVMEQNFADAQKRLDRWEEGGFSQAKDFGPAPKSGTTRPGRERRSVQTSPANPTPAPAATTPAPSAPAPVAVAPQRSTVIGPSASVSATDMDSWEAYVRQFIADYKLDTTQSNQAFGILTEMRKRAAEYRASRKNDYQKYQTILATDPRDAEASAQIKELDKPIGELFTELKLRLDQIPTEGQRKAYEQTQGPKATSTQVATRPASTQPTQAASTRPVRPIRSPAQSRPIGSRPVTRQ